MTPAQEAALLIIDENGSSYSGTANNAQTNTVHHRTAAALVRAGICEWIIGCDGPFVRRSRTLA